jgi:hypothetical protein
MLTSAFVHNGSSERRPIERPPRSRGRKLRRNGRRLMPIHRIDHPTLVRSMRRGLYDYNAFERRPNVSRRRQVYEMGVV